MRFAPLTLAATLLIAAPAGATGGYLHLREANVLAGHLVVKEEHQHGGVVTLLPCHRVSAREATCPQTWAKGPFECSGAIRVTKSDVAGRFRWRTAAGRLSCDVVA